MNVIGALIKEAQKTTLSPSPLGGTGNEPPLESGSVGTRSCEK